MAWRLLFHRRVQASWLGKLEEDETFGRYRVLECLGVGGMATVHRAIERDTGQEVALKRLLPQLVADDAVIEQFVREARIGCVLHHESIVDVFEHGRVGDVHYIAMELVRGTSLLTLLRCAYRFGRPAPIGVAVAVLESTLAALAYASCTTDPDDGSPLFLVHRDISPSNIVVTPDGSLKVIDFGVAKAIEGRFATQSGRIKGKLGYMAPEVFDGEEVDHRSDLFSLAVVVWELLTAQRMFSGPEEVQLAQRSRGREMTPASSINSSVPQAMDDLLMVALSRRNLRWPSATAMRVALSRSFPGLSVDAAPAAVAAWAAELDARATLLGPPGGSSSWRPESASGLSGCLSHDYGLLDSGSCNCEGLPEERGTRDTVKTDEAEVEAEVESMMIG